MITEVEQMIGKTIVGMSLVALPGSPDGFNFKLVNGVMELLPGTGHFKLRGNIQGAIPQQEHYNGECIVVLFDAQANHCLLSPKVVMWQHTAGMLSAEVS